MTFVAELNFNSFKLRSTTTLGSNENHKQNVYIINIQLKNGSFKSSQDFSRERLQGITLG